MYDEELDKQRARRRKIKKMTGYESNRCFCSVCHKLFTDREIDRDEIIYAVGKLGSVQMHKRCFKKLYSGGC